MEPNKGLLDSQLTQYITNLDYRGNDSNCQEPLSKPTFNSPDEEVEYLRKVCAIKDRQILALQAHLTRQITTNQSLKQIAPADAFLKEEEVKDLLDKTIQTFVDELAKSPAKLKELGIKLQKDKKFTIDTLIAHLEKTVAEEQRPADLSQSWIWPTPKTDEIQATLDDIHRLFRLNGNKPLPRETLKKALDFTPPKKTGTTLATIGTVGRWTFNGIIFGYNHFWIVTVLLGALKGGTGGPLMGMLFSILTKALQR